MESTFDVHNLLLASVKMLGKTILLSQTPDVFTFLHPILVCRITHWALLELLIPHLQWSPVMWPCKNIFHIQFSFFSFCNPTHKTETGTAKQIGGTLLIATYLDQSLWWANQKYWPSDHIYYSLFCRCTVLLRPLPATPNCATMLSQNHFPDPNRHVLTFSSSNVTVQITYSHYWRCSKVFLQSLRKRKSIMTSR